MTNPSPVVFIQRGPRTIALARVGPSNDPPATWESAGRALAFWGIVGAVVVGGFLYLGLKEGFTA